MTAPCPFPIIAVAVSAKANSRIEILEGKVQLLDDKIVALKERLAFLTHQRIARDDKMLKDNLDSRWQWIEKLNRAEHDLAIAPGNDHPADQKTTGLSNISSLEKHLQKKS